MPISRQIICYYLKKFKQKIKSNAAGGIENSRASQRNEMLFSRGIFILATMHPSLRLFFPWSISRIFITSWVQRVQGSSEHECVLEGSKAYDIVGCTRFPTAGSRWFKRSGVGPGRVCRSYLMGWCVRKTSLLFSLATSDAALMANFSFLRPFSLATSKPARIVG